MTNEEFYYTINEIAESGDHPAFIAKQSITSLFEFGNFTNDGIDQVKSIAMWFEAEKITQDNSKHPERLLTPIVIPNENIAPMIANIITILVKSGQKEVALDILRVVRSKIN